MNPSYQSPSDSEITTHDHWYAHRQEVGLVGVGKDATTPTRTNMNYDVQVIRSTERTVSTADRTAVCETAVPPPLCPRRRQVQPMVDDGRRCQRANSLMGIEITATDSA